MSLIELRRRALRPAPRTMTSVWCGGLPGGCEAEEVIGRGVGEKSREPELGAAAIGAAAGRAGEDVECLERFEVRDCHVDREERVAELVGHVEEGLIELAARAHRPTCRQQDQEPPP